MKGIKETFLFQTRYKKIKRLFYFFFLFLIDRKSQLFNYTHTTINPLLYLFFFRFLKKLKIFSIFYKLVVLERTFMKRIV